MKNDSDGQPVLTLPDKPVKREQKPDEKNKAYKKYIDEEFKPIVLEWKEKNLEIQEAYDQLIETFAMNLNPCDKIKCDVLAECTVLENGEPICNCIDGYEGDGITDSTGCQDVNECLTKTHNCPDAWECVNLPGRFTCIKSQPENKDDVTQETEPEPGLRCSCRS